LGTPTMKENNIFCTSLSEEKKTKKIRIGSDFQVNLNLIQDSEEIVGECLWNPEMINSVDVDYFLENVKEGEVDVEEAFEYLRKCCYSVKEALNGLKKRENKNLGWREEEVTLFENGMKLFYKEFDIIKQYLERENCYKSLKEIINFYYFWKKSVLFDIWLQKQIEIEENNSQNLMDADEYNKIQNMENNIEGNNIYSEGGLAKKRKRSDIDDDVDSDHLVKKRKIISMELPEEEDPSPYFLDSKIPLNLSLEETFNPAPLSLTLDNPLNAYGKDHYLNLPLDESDDSEFIAESNDENSGRITSSSEINLGDEIENNSQTYPLFIDNFGWMNEGNQFQ